MASAGFGVRNVVTNATGVEYIMKLSPVSYTIGGIYIDSTTYLIAGSAVLDNGLGLDIAYNGVTSNYNANFILQKEVAVSPNMGIVGTVNLISYASASSTLAALTGGGCGLRVYL